MKQLHLSSKKDKKQAVCGRKNVLFIEGSEVFTEHLLKNPESCCSICTAKGKRKRIILNGIKNKLHGRLQ